MTRLGISNSPLVDPSGVLPSFSPVDSVIRAGTLAIFDPSHSTAPLAAVPANGALLRNIVPTEQLNDLLGATHTDEDYSWVAAISGLGAGVALLELTPKGALNATITQTSQAAAVLAGVALRDTIKQYMLDHLDHTFLLVEERATTRAAITSGLAANASPPNFIAQNTVSLTANFLGYHCAAGFYPASGIHLVDSEVQGGHNTVGESFRSLAVTGFTGTAPTTPGAFNVFAGFGQPTGYNSSPWYNKLSSGALRRFVIEDLTVSGITHDRAVLGSGLRDSHIEQWVRDLTPDYGRWDDDVLRAASTLP